MSGGYGSQIPPVQTPTFAAANFYNTGGGSWTVAAFAVRYRVVDGVMWLAFYGGGVVGGTLNASVKMRIPGGYVAKADMNFVIFGYTNAGPGWEIQTCYVLAGSNEIVFNRAGGANWTAGGNQVSGEISFEVQ